MPKWITKQSKTTYANPWLTVSEDSVVRPDGKDGIYGTVSIAPGISVLVLDDAEFVYLVKEYKYPLKLTSLEIVGGGIENNETPLDAAKRELREELGIEASHWIDLGTYNPMTTFLNSPQHLFLAQSLSFFETKHEGTEDIEIVKIPFSDAVDMVIKGEITEGKSCVAILKASKILGL